LPSVNQKGQSIVEFAIILPILLLVVMGIFQFGLMFNAYLTVENVTREGARTGALGGSNTEIKSVIVSAAFNLDSDRLTVNITPNESGRNSGDTLTVKVTYSYELTVPIISDLFGDEIELAAQTSMRVE